ncbi:hypothetical protein LPTSP4_32090 [Leptospira ryugenii]|uniref:Copper-binding protein MbnP-like domain-containing protein n=1 Tax=Leptospira ryugenii TaxID=1917863 RepID=A0A2P2E469_9LEPT|nr:MbnP family copper-binding protein [Leptospira ryugenii]GBF51671.1 hypothetical protein LPTSP4_32090 [Leptospira ryugenii]
MNKLIYLLILILISASAFSCQTEKSNDNDLGLVALAVIANGSAVTSIPFELVSGTDAFSCNQAISGSGSTQLQLRDARFFVHDVKLVKADGSTTDFILSTDDTWQNGTVALLDFENRTGQCTVGTTDTNKTLRGYAAPGLYVGVEFKVGVPTAQNKLLNTTGGAPLNTTGMYWSWTTGYKFMKFEWRALEGAGSTNQFHTGGVSCTGGNGNDITCAYPNIPTVRITRSNNAIWSATENPIYINIQELVKNTNSNLSNGGASYTCMAGNTTASCKSILNSIGINETDGKTLSTQSAFSIKN